MSKEHEDRSHEKRHGHDDVLVSSDADPVFPTESEYQVDAGSDDGPRSKHPGLIWIVIAVVAVVISCIIFALAGDWFTPQEAQQINDEMANYQIDPSGSQN